MKVTLAIEEHPYSPDELLNKEQAEKMLAQERLYSRITVTRCKQNSINISGAGHICKSDLEQYIKRELQNIEQSKNLYYI